MLVSYLFWFIASTLLSCEVNGIHFLSNLCTDTKIGTYAYPGVYNVYFECEYGNATIYACPLGMNFDPIFTKCSEKKVPYDRSFCSNNGLHLPHPFHCTKFIRCLDSEIKIINCKTPMVYSIDTNRCEYKVRVSACRRRLEEDNLRTDLNTYTHYNTNEIIGKKRDTQHELTNFDEEADEDIDKDSEKFNGSSQSSDELDELTLKNETRDDDLSSSKQNSSDQITVNFSDNIPRTKEQNYTKIDKNEKLSIADMHTLLTILGAPFNVSIKEKQTNSTVDDQALKTVLETFFSIYDVDKRNETSTENINLSLQTNISSLNVDASEDISDNLITNSNDARYFPDDVEVITQSTEILSSSSPSALEESEEEETDSSIISEEIQSTIVSSKKIDTSTLVSSVANIVLEEVEDTVVSSTPTTEVNDNMTVLGQHSDKAETTLRYSENDEATVTTSSSVSEIVNTDISSTIDEKVEEISSLEPTLLDSGLDIIDKVASGTENVKEVENITVNDSTKVENTIVPVPMTEISTPESTGSDEIPLINPTVSLNGGKIENITISSQHEKKSLSNSVQSISLGSEIDISKDLESDADSISEVIETKADDTEDITGQSVISFSEQTTNIPVVEHLNANITATTEFEFTAHSIPLEITSTTTKNHEYNEAPVVFGDIAVTTESHKDDSTSPKPEYINMAESDKNDETVEIIEDIAATIKSQVDSTSTTLENINIIGSQKNDNIPETPEPVSSFVESLTNEEVSSTLPDDNLSVNRNNVPSQEMLDAPTIQNDADVSLLDIDSDIAQVAESADDTIRLSRSAELANFTETTNYIPLAYGWHNARSIKTIAVPKQRLRLNGGAQANYGYVEVKGIDNIWRGVCQSTDWTIAEADIICRELGYQNAQKAWKGHSNQVEIPTWSATSSIQCHGDEDWVDNCRFQDEAECDLQRNAVGVECILSDTTPY